MGDYSIFKGFVATFNFESTDSNNVPLMLRRVKSTLNLPSMSVILNASCNNISQSLGFKTKSNKL